MLGTEVPDYGKTVDKVRTLTLDKFCGPVSVGYKIAGFGGQHTYLIDWDGLPWGSAESREGERNCRYAFERALYHFLRNECEAGAYYLGCMIHLISDASCFPHVLPSVYVEPVIKPESPNLPVTLENVQATFEPQVSKLNGHPYKEPPTQFHLDTHGWTGEYLEPSIAIYQCARATFLGGNGLGAAWMFNQVALACTLDPVNHAWQFLAEKICDLPEYELLFWCIERDMNCGVYYGAAAVQFVYRLVKSTLKCDCNQDTLKHGIYKYIYEYQILQLMQEMAVLVGFTLTGKISAVIAQIIASKSSRELDPLVPVIQF